MNIALWIAQCLLALVYVVVGAMKTFQIARVRAQFSWTNGRSGAFVRFVGISEILGGLGLILPMLTGILPWLTPLAAISLSVIQVLAIVGEHLPRKEFRALPLNAVFLGLSLFIVIGRWMLFSQLVSAISMSSAKLLYALFAARFSRVVFY